jgi:cytoskeletal protein CcmA (bactofilin family)
MLGLRKPLQIKSTLGADMRVNGQCIFQGSLQIDGVVAGQVLAESGPGSVLVIGAGGRVEGAVCADHVSVAGTIIGPVQARERLELLATARIEGDVRYKMLEMQPGAVVAGQLQPQVAPPPAAPAEPAVLAPAPAAEPVEPTEPTLEPDRLL